MSDLTIWHNRRCSKRAKRSRLIEGGGSDRYLRLYLQDPPAQAENHGHGRKPRLR